MTFLTGPNTDRSQQQALRQASVLLNNAQRILVGIGAGVSASGGFNYMDPGLARRWYPEYADLGLETILEIQSRFWWLSRCRPEEYWAFWGRHIYHIRYEPSVLKPYSLLYSLLKGRNYFICSTNVDGQLEEAGCDKQRIFSPQGDYALFQCCRPCHATLYNNRSIIERMISRMPDPFHIRTEDIPFCPRCGAHLVPNLRCDHTFVQEPHLDSQPDYENFVDGCSNQQTVIVEFGVGHNTPGIIRYPFEEFTRQIDRCHLLRVNTEEQDIPADIADKSISFPMDITAWLRAVADCPAEQPSP